MVRMNKNQKSNILYLIFNPLLSQKMAKTGIPDFSKNILLPEKRK